MYTVKITRELVEDFFEEGFEYLNNRLHKTVKGLPLGCKLIAARYDQVKTNGLLILTFKELGECLEYPFENKVISLGITRTDI